MNERADEINQNAADKQDDKNCEIKGHEGCNKKSIICAILVAKCFTEIT